MGKKKRKTQRNNNSGPPQLSSRVPNQAEAVGRLTKLMNIMSAPPESVLELLDRVEIRWEKTSLTLEAEGIDCVVIRWSDLMEGERRIKEEGSLLKRLYGKEIQDQATAGWPTVETNNGPIDYVEKPMRDVHLPEVFKPGIPWGAGGSSANSG